MLVQVHTGTIRGLTAASIMRTPDNTNGVASGTVARQHAGPDQGSGAS